MNTNTYHIDRHIMRRFVWNQVPPSGETVILANGGDGPVAATIIPKGDGRTGYELEITTNCPEWATVQEIYDFYRRKDMTFAESRKQFRNDFTVSRCQRLFDEGVRLFPERLGIPQHHSDAKRPRITVDVEGRTIAVDGTTYAVSDYHDCLILDVLVKAKGNRMSRAEMKQVEPKLRNKGRIDRRISKLQATYPIFEQLIESNTKGFRIMPFWFE